MNRAGLLVLVLLTGCGASDATPAPSTTSSSMPTPARTTHAPPASVTTGPATVSAHPTTTAATRVPVATSPAPTILPDDLQRYMLRLEGIRPDLSSSEQAAIAHGRALCARAHVKDVTYQELLDFTATEFGRGADEPLSQQTVSDVYEVVRDELCPQ